jgi:hypothetical protein
MTRKRILLTKEREKKKATVRENDLHFFFLDVEDGSDEVKAQFSL